MVDDGVVGKCITVIQSGEPNVSQIAPGNLVFSNFRFYPGRRLTTIVPNLLLSEPAVYNLPLVANDFDVPDLLETERLRLRPLTIHDAVRDYDAVMTSEQRLRTVFEPGGDWPSGLTLEQNIIELGWHQTEFQLRTSFAYTVVCLDESEVLGCVYFYPTQKDQYDVEVTLWVRQSRVAEGLDQHLFETLESWIADVWPFNNPAYPGRHISFEEWRE